MCSSDLDAVAACQGGGEHQRQAGQYDVVPRGRGAARERYESSAERREPGQGYDDSERENGLHEGVAQARVRGAVCQAQLSFTT